MLLKFPKIRGFEAARGPYYTIKKPEIAGAPFSPEVPTGILSVIEQSTSRIRTDRPIDAFTPALNPLSSPICTTITLALCVPIPQKDSCEQTRRSNRINVVSMAMPVAVFQPVSSLGRA